MNYKWLLILACLFCTACEQAKKDDPDNNKEADKTAQKKDLNNGFKNVANDRQGDQDDDVDKNSNPAEALAAKFRAERDEFFSIYRKTPSEERKALLEQMPQAETYLPEMKQLAEENPNTEIAATAYVWIVSMIRDDKELVENSYQQLFENYADSEKMREVCMGFIRAFPTPKVEQRINTLIENSPHHEVKAIATYAKANYLQSVISAKESLNEPRMSYLDKESVEYIKASNFDMSMVEELYETIEDKYPNVKIYGERKLGSLATSNLFELRNLAIGCTAPDIVGNDLDGTKFKLSDYRGKVVLLDFWGDW